MRRVAVATAFPFALSLAACASGGAPHDAGLDASFSDTARDDGDDDDAPPAAEIPLTPVGLDALRQWDRLPYLRIGTRAYLRSTYDRAGGNEAADASHFLRMEAADRFVALDVEGPGVLAFVRTNHWHGSPWHYGIDGEDHVITESSTADPDHPIAGSVFMPERALPSPLAYTWSVTQGADLNWVAAPFEHALSLAYGRTHYGTGYFIVHRFAEGADNLTQPLRAWDARTPPADDVLALVSRAGGDIAPDGDGVSTLEGTVNLPAAGAPVTVATLEGLPRAIRVLRFTVARADADALGRARVRITWDDRATPSVDAPVSLLFGTGSLFNRDDRADLVRGFMAAVHFDAQNVTLSLYYPMPFLRRARIELYGATDAVAGVHFHLRSVPADDAPGRAGYFHATYRDHGTPVPGRDLVLLDTTQTEGGGDWCGSFVGTSFIFSDRASLSTLEGDPRFFFDDSETPQGQGTGTEEWGGGGDYWGGRTMTLPFAGHPVGAPDAPSARNAEDQIESAYRFLVSDAMPFGRNARIQLEHGGNDDSTEHYRTVTYWYGLPGACLVPTDALHVGDVDDEARHRYLSPTAGPVETLTSRYEWGPDHVGAQEIYPASTDTGRRMTGTSEFTLALARDNVGVLLRRKLDYALPDQRADVFVADDRGGATFAHAGVWYTAGANRCVFADSPTETGAGDPVVETSNRRFRDDEFLLPRQLTQGRASIRVRVVFAPRDTPLLPNAPPVERAWSEFRYWAYSYVLPPR